MLKKIFINLRKSFKFICILGIGISIIVGIFSLVYKPTYSVFLNGKQIGYTENEAELQKRINQYVENGDGTNNSLAFMQINQLPTYEICMLKKDIVTNDDEIFNLVTKEGVPYYRYYSILVDQQEKAYVSNFQEAEKIVAQLKEKKSNNIDKIAIIEKYETALQTFSTVEKVVADLYVEKPKPIVKKPTVYYTGSTKTSYSRAEIGINLVRPISGVITSRFGPRWGSVHKGLDIAAPTGTTIKAAATGTVTFVRYSNSGLGNHLKISHSNGVETVYGHCSKLYVKEGQQVNQGDSIAAVGSTGNSTGPHLHLEVRKNGVAYNPQNYVY